MWASHQEKPVVGKTKEIKAISNVKQALRAALCHCSLMTIIFIAYAVL